MEKNKKYLQTCVNLADKSLDKGGFPAGAVLVLPDGETYESEISVAWNHGESQVLHMAKLDGKDLGEAVLYTTTEPCIMCISKAYWSEVKKIIYITPREDLDIHYAYEGEHKSSEYIGKMNTKIEMIKDDSLIKETMDQYNRWKAKIES